MKPLHRDDVRGLHHDDVKPLHHDDVRACAAFYKAKKLKRLCIVPCARYAGLHERAWKTPSGMSERILSLVLAGGSGSV